MPFHSAASLAVSMTCCPSTKLIVSIGDCHYTQHTKFPKWTSYSAYRREMLHVASL